MRLRHELWKKKYPDAKEVRGMSWSGKVNRRLALDLTRIGNN